VGIVGVVAVIAAVPLSGDGTSDGNAISVDEAAGNSAAGVAPIDQGAAASDEGAALSDSSRSFPGWLGASSQPWTLTSWRPA
jgi:hypothetical protein